MYFGINGVSYPEAGHSGYRRAYVPVQRRHHLAPFQDPGEQVGGRVLIRFNYQFTYYDQETDGRQGGVHGRDVIWLVTPISFNS